MKVYESKEIRNVGIVGHGHSGKTSLVAGLLFTSGAVNRLTRVDEGNTPTDYDDEEIQRKLTVSTSIAAVFLTVVGTYGYYAMFLFWTACTILYFITATFFLPETKGRTLEEIEEYFEHPQQKQLA